MTRRDAPQLGRLFGLVLGLLGLGPAAATAAPPPPAAWVAYADLVRQALPGWLADDTAANRRLVAYFDSLRPTPASPTPPIVLRIWIDPDGKVSRVEGADPALAAEGPDLAASLVGRSLPRAPPPDLKWPIRLAFQLAPLPSKLTTSTPS